METFSALLAICAGNSPVPGEFSHKGQWRGALMFSLICVWINDWVNNREAGDLRRYLAHHDVTVMWRAVIGTCRTELSQVTHPGINPVRWHNRQCSNYLVELVAHSMPTHFTAIGSTPKGFIIDNTQRLSLMKNLLKLEYSHSRKCHLIYHWHFAPLR